MNSPESSNLYCTSVFILSLFLLSCGTDTAPQQPDSAKKIFPDSMADTSEARVHDKIWIAPSTISQENGMCVLALSDPMKIALEKYNPDFQVWSSADFVRSCDGNKNYYSCNEHQLQFAVVADFNGDSVNDLAVLGHTYKNTVLVGVLSDSLGYSTLEIAKFPLEFPETTWIDDKKNTGLYTYMEYCSPEKAATSNWGSKEIEYDAFLYGTCGKGFSIYWLKNGKFQNGTFTD